MKSHRCLYFGLVGFLACALLAQAPTVSASSGAASPQAQSNTLPAMGQAPLLKFKILNQSAQETTYAVIFGAGDEVLGGLTQFAQDRHISAARITGIGSIHNGTLAWLNPETKKFYLIHIDQQAEVLSLLGDIAMYQGKPVVHVHMVVGFGDGTAHGGHLLQAHVWPTLEVIVTAYPRPLYKKFDPEKGIAVIDPSVQK
ncbi:MAG: PPC domain-containing DNA-binding protein [Acidobacteriaceae bacterium]